MNQNHSQSALGGVLRRELRRITSKRLYLWTILILPLFVVFFMGTIFNTGQMTNIPVGVVDLDFTASSRSVVRMLDASPILLITNHYTDPAEARKAVQQKKIYGYVIIPQDFEKKVLSGKSTTISYYYHFALLSVGAEVHVAFETILRTVSAAPVAKQALALGMPPEEVVTLITPSTIQSHPIYNPNLDYAIYLSQPFFFVIFQIIILLMTVYSIGAEMKFGTSEEWLGAAQGSMFTALVGKLLPYTVVYILVSIFANFMFFGVMHIPYDNNFLSINVVSILFILSTQALALFVFALFPAMSITISIVSMLGSLGATLSGVTFPLPSMYAVFYYFSYALPIRYYVEIVQTLLYTKGSLSVEWVNMLILVLFCALPYIILKRLKTCILNHKYDEIE